MTLLQEVMERPLDPGYAAAAASSEARRPGRVATVLTVGLAMVAGFLLIRAVSGLRVEPPERARDVLQTEIERRGAAADAREAANVRLRDQIAQSQRAALGPGSVIVDRADALGLWAGEIGVTGPGLEYTLTDARSTAAGVGEDPRSGADPDHGVVIDRDLQIVVNGLWAAGAEAVAVNGERLTALSAIRSAGQAILVDYRPLVPPYVVRAIGDPAGMQTRFATDLAGTYVQSLQENFDIEVSVTAQESMTLPGSGPLTVRTAKGTDGKA
jgi:uncharacterized protein YlxW (UPF0749 family)